MSAVAKLSGYLHATTDRENVESHIDLNSAKLVEGSTTEKTTHEQVKQGFSRPDNTRECMR